MSDYFDRPGPTGQPGIVAQKVVTIPYVEGGKLYTPTGAAICALPAAPPDRTGWLDWLSEAEHRSFRFIGRTGAHCTVIKEMRAGRSGEKRPYWYAHRHIFGKLHRVYLGKSEKLTLSALEAAAAKLAQLEMEAAGGQGSAKL